MAKLTKKELGAMGKKITSKAKEIRKQAGATPVTTFKYKMSWTDAMKKAGKEMKKSK